MKAFKSILAVTLTLAFTVPAFAGGNDKQAQEQCQILIGPECLAFLLLRHPHSISAAASNGTISS